MPPFIERARQATRPAWARGVMQLRALPPPMRGTLAVLMFLLMLVQVGLRPWLQDEAREASNALHQLAGHSTVDSRLTVSSPADQLWAQLPASTTFDGDLDVLVASAQRLGLPLPKAQIRRMDAPKALRIEEVDLELEASYGVIRRFVARNLNELPHASLRRIRLERAMADGAAAPFPPAVRATVTLRLHYRQPGYDS